MVDLIFQEMQWFSWIALVYLLFVGTRATKPGGICLKTFSTIPVAFVVSKYKVLYSFDTLMLYAIAVAIAMLIGYFFAKNEDVQFVDGKTIIPGSYSVLIAAVLFFTIKYPLGHLIHSLYDSLPVSCPYRDSILLGLFVGFFFGKFVAYLSAKKESN